MNEFSDRSSILLVSTTKNTLRQSRGVFFVAKPQRESNSERFERSKIVQWTVLQLKDRFRVPKAHSEVKCFWSESISQARWLDDSPSRQSHGVFFVVLTSERIELRALVGMFSISYACTHS